MGCSESQAKYVDNVSGERITVNRRPRYSGKTRTERTMTQKAKEAQSLSLTVIKR